MRDDQDPGTALSTRPSERALARPLASRAVSVPLTVGVVALGLLPFLRFNRVVLIVAIVALGLGLWRLMMWKLWQGAMSRAASTPGTPEDASRKALKRSLSRLQFLEHVDPLIAERAFTQYEASEERFERFQELLDTKFERTELTYGRYLSAAENLHRAVLDHLRDVAGMLNSLDALDAPAARRDLARLEARGASSEDETRTQEGLRERLAIAERTTSEVRARLSFNEEALTEMDRVNLALASIKTSKHDAGIDLESTLEEVRVLAERAKKYSM